MKKAGLLLSVVFAAAALVMTSGGCEGERGESNEGGGAPSDRPLHVETSLRVAKEIELTDAMKRGRLAFRARTGDGAFESGTASWYARSTKDGARFVPLASHEGELPGEGLTVRTTGVRRGAWSLSLGEGFAPDARGILVREGEAGHEWLRGEDGGLEQGWTFDAAPGGDGPLVVTVALDGATFERASDDGLHVETPSGGVVYGHGTWIDASGARTDVPAVWSSGAVRLEVPDALLDESSYPATLDPLIGPELETDPGIFGTSDKGTSALYAACTATTCMAFFRDSVGIQRMRFAPDGTLLDPVPVLVNNAPDAIPSGMTTFNDQFVLLWKTGSSSNEGLHARRFDESGAFVGGQLALSSGTPVYASDAACSTDRCVVAWQANNGQVVTKRFDTAGLVLDPFGTLLTQQGNDIVSAAFDGTNFIIGYANRVTRFTPAGVNLHPTGLSLGFQVYDVVSNGAETLAVGNGGVRIINPDGTLGTQVSSGNFFRSVAWTGDRYLALSYYSPITGQAFDVTGQPMGSAIAYGSGASASALATARPGGAFVGAHDTGDGWLRTVDASGSPTAAPFYVNVGSNPQHRPIVIAGTNQYLAAWLDRRLGSYGIYAQRYDAAGNALDAIPILVLSEPTPTSERALAGASDGTDYLLVSSAYPGFAKRISSSGVVLDPAALALDMGTGSYSVSWDGVNYVVAGFTGSVRVKRVSGGGVILDPSPITVPVAGTTDHQISSSFNGTAHVILVRSFGTVYYVQLSPGGTVIGSPTTAGSFDPMPRIACRPTGTCLISNGETTKTLFPSATLSIPGAPSFTYGPPGVALGGNEYLLAAPSTEVSGIRLSTANPPVPIGSWFNISQSPATDEVAVSAASLGDGTSLVAYERYVEAESASRVYLRAIVLAAPNGAPCTAAADCQSAACVDGVCCNSACGNGANDCQACSIAAGASTDGTCAPIAAGTQCRASAGECDVAESCDGTATVCPADGVAGTDVVCRDAQGDCDVAETCNGLTASCPTNTFATAAVECRAANGDCDVAENCSGSGPNCPADTAAPSTTVCRASIGDCDAEETCDGTATTCPVDVAAAPTTVCRPAAGLCDAEETCGGAFECPADGVLPAGTSCRDAVHQCDVEDFCDGSSSACDNEGAPAETPCGGAPSGACDSPDTCSGGPGTENECVDWVYTETQVCRRAAGDCDQEERCTGFGPQCPTDKFISGEVCRGSQSTCDAEESCDGSGPECPADAAVPDGTQCEEGSVCAAGACVPESTGEAGGEPTTSTGSGSNDDDGGDGGDGAEDDSGCSCRTAGTRNASSPWALALVGLVVAARARRRVTGGHPSARSRAAGAGQMLRNN